MKKKQHFIQQSFLKNFTIDNYHLFIFDKHKNEVRKSNIGDVFEEKSFYRLPITKYYGIMSEENKNSINFDLIRRFGKPFNELNKDEQNEAEEWIEDYFANEIEPIFISTITELRENIGKRILNQLISPITEKIRINLSSCLANYYVRTKAFRENLNNGMSNIYKQIVVLQAQMNGLDIDENDLDVTFNKEQAKMNHISIMGKLIEDETIVKIIHSRIWSIVLNKTKTPFILSDRLLTIKATQEVPPYHGIGLATPGVEIYFPISSKVMLVMNDPITFAYIKDGRIAFVDNEKIINDINAFLLINSHRYCACERGDNLINLTNATKKYK